MQNRRLDVRSRAMQAALGHALNRFAKLEYRKAIRDPHAYAGLSRRVAKRRDNDDEIRREFQRLLVMFGLREAADASGRVGGPLINETLIAQATENKAVKIQWMWNVRNGAVKRTQDFLAGTREAARASVKRIILDSLDEKDDSGEKVQPGAGEIARRIYTSFQGPDSERDPQSHAKEGDRDFVFSFARAGVIARTELAQAQNAGTFAGYEATGAEGLEWVSYSDGRSGSRRHDKMNGVRIRLGEMFTLPSGVKMRHPAEFTGPIGETINCRCTVIALFSDVDDIPDRQRT